ncbi:MAG: hypothetical protein AAF334_00140 [Pseudomonadota bacterium]
MRSRKFALAIMLKAVDRATRPVRKVVSALRQRLGPVVDRVGERLRRLNNQFRKAGLAGAMTRSLGRVRGAMLGLTATATAASLAVVAFWRSFVNRGDAIAKQSAALGLSAEAFQELQFAADRSGVSNQQFTTGLRGFVTRVGQAKDGTGELFSLLKRSGPATLGLLRGAKTTEEAFEIILTQIGRIEDVAERNALASAAFGTRAGAAFTVLASEGSDGVAALRAEARLLGIIANQGAADAEHAQDAWTNFTATLRGLANIINEKVTPRITLLLEGLTKAGQDGKPQISALGDAIRDLVPTADQLIAFFQRLGDAVQSFRSTMAPVIDLFGGEWNTVLAAFATVTLAPVVTALASLAVALAAAGPLMLGLAALAGAALLIVRNWESIGEFFGGVLGTLKSRFDSAMTAIGNGVRWLTGAADLVTGGSWSGVEAYFDGIWNGVAAAFKRARAFVEPIIGWFARAASTISGIGESVTDFFSGEASTRLALAGPAITRPGGAARRIPRPAFQRPQPAVNADQIVRTPPSRPGARGGQPAGAATLSIKVEDDRTRTVIDNGIDGLSMPVDVGRSRAGGGRPS